MQGAVSFSTLSRRFTITSLFPTPCHVVDEWAIDIGAPATDGIEECVRVCDEILFVGELIRDDLGVTDVAEHHQATRHADCFSSCTRSHGVYTDPF